MKTSQILEAARNLIQRKSSAISSLEECLDQSFEKSVELILECKGKLIVSGIGKSGHIAGKIASTLSSISVPSVFLHPSEASHGDLGLITKDDVLIILSNGGESQEIYDLLDYATLNGNSIIGIVGNKNSTLYKKSNIQIFIPSSDEGTDIKAPMISTSKMLTCGDAIAAAIIKVRKITNEKFKRTHPGGKIGATPTYVNEVMRTGDKVPVLDVSDSMPDAILEMTKKSIGCVAVLAGKKFVGVITDGDLRRKMDQDILSLNVKDVMSVNPMKIQENVRLIEALEIMNKNKITSLFVLNNSSKLTGVIHMHDCLMLGIKHVETEE